MFCYSSHQKVSSCILYKHGVCNNYCSFAVPTSHPQNVTAVPSDASTLHIYWSPPPPDKQNGDIMKYGINITDVESGQTSQYYTSGPQTSVIVRHLSPHMLYQYSIAATTAIGNGPFSPSQTIRMPSAGMLMQGIT